VGQTAMEAMAVRAAVAGAGADWTGTAGAKAAGAADTAPAGVFCRWSGVSRMVPFCHAYQSQLSAMGFMTLADRGAAGGCCDPARKGTKRAERR
jgi:hypothetical protein